MKQQNLKSQETQNLGGTSIMGEQTFKVSEGTSIREIHVFKVSKQTYNNLVTESAAAGKSESDFIREKLATAAEYIDEFDFNDCIRHDRIKYLRNQLHERKAKGKPVDDIIEDIMMALDEQFAECEKLEELRNLSKRFQISKRDAIAALIILSSEENKQLKKIAEHFKISKRAVLESIINYDWND